MTRTRVTAPTSLPTSLSGADRFTAAMSTRPCARTPLFFAHHAPPAVPADTVQAELSTGPTASVGKFVDDAVQHGGEATDAVHAGGICLGLVVPKRHARRAVTRNLIRRHIRLGATEHAAALAVGDWVVRLRAPIDRQVFPSARSDALRQRITDELTQLWAEAVRRRPRLAAH